MNFIHLYKEYITFINQQTVTVDDGNFSLIFEQKRHF